MQRLYRNAGFAPAVLLAMAFALAASACGGSPRAPGAQPVGPQPRLDTAVLRSGEVSIEVELALSDTEKQAGLMFRKELADGQGMLFAYDEDRRMSFWMKNTLIPLSIAFVSSDGTIREIRDMEARSLAPVESARFVRYAIEAPLGWFGRVGLKEGDRFELPEGFPKRR